MVGTPPLGLDLSSSDIDIICHASDAEAFMLTVRQIFGHEDGFTLERRDGPPQPIIASFRRCGWPIEIYAIDQPTAEQPGWLHFEVERRLLQLGDEKFEKTVQRLRAEGLKTEPAFASILGLAGDPFQALIELSIADDGGLIRVLAKSGYNRAQTLG